jgi:hypothetical protein
MNALNLCDKLFLFYISKQKNSSVSSIGTSKELEICRTIIFHRLKRLEQNNKVVRIFGLHRRDIYYKVVD